MQAHVNALLKSEEHVMQCLVDYGRLEGLVTMLLTSEAWKQFVLPLIKPDVA